MNPLYVVQTGGYHSTRASHASKNKNLVTSNANMKQQY